MHLGQVTPTRVRRYFATTRSDESSPVFPDLPRHMTPNGPNQLGPRSGFVYHNLADAVGMHYLAGAPVDGMTFAEEASRLATETRDLALEYISFGSKIVGRALLDYGFKRRGSMARHLS